MKKSFVFASLIFLASSVFAQSTYEFLRLDTSPRAAALAGSYVSNNDDPNVIFYNPAGINLLKGSPASFSFLKYLMDINVASLAISEDFEGIGRFGAGVQYINYGTFTKADESGTNLGSFSAGEMAISIGYGNQLDENFYYGANLKFIYSSIAGISSTAAAADVGLHYTIPDQRLNFGFSAMNLGTQLKSYFDTREELPVDVRLGFSKELEKLPFRFFWSFNRMTDKESSFIKHFGHITAGGEFRLGKSFRLRLGYDNQKRKDLKIGSTPGLTGFSLGLGFIIKNYNVDYSFSSLGSIGSLHRFGISTDLDTFK
jgi:hypothetical protein